MDRPQLRDDYIAKAAAEDLLPELMEWAEARESERATYLSDAVDVMKDAAFKNGYELARDLERGGYEPDARLVEILDGAFGLLLTRHRCAVKEWVKGWNISVPWKVGQRVLVTHKGKDYVGAITAIKAAEAICIVSVRDLGHAPGCGLVINSEAVVPAEAVAQTAV